ncbi:MAG: BadF/BadG/BcrA/BcrD ATPase family protein, partial [Bacteroidota bacterium]
MRKRFVIGIDGGGTKTKGAIADLTGSLLSEKQTGSTNVHIVGYAGAARGIWNLIRELAEQTRGDVGAVSLVVAGLAGMGRLSDRKALLQALKRVAGNVRFSLRRIQVCTDAEIALAGAFRGGPGIVIIAGTGSIVIGKDERGDIHRVGGWGRVLGDEGSGYQLGKKALAAVAQSYDGRSAPTALTDAFLERLRLSDVSGLVEKVSSNAFDVSTLAPLVLEVANRGDRIAGEIVRQSADDLIV